MKASLSPVLIKKVHSELNSMHYQELANVQVLHPTNIPNYFNGTLTLRLYCHRGIHENLYLELNSTINCTSYVVKVMTAFAERQTRHHATVLRGELTSVVSERNCNWWQKKNDYYSSSPEDDGSTIARRSLRNLLNQIFSTQNHRQLL